jgi:hypothetical protein
MQFLRVGVDRRRGVAAVPDLLLEEYWKTWMFNIGIFPRLDRLRMDLFVIRKVKQG